jgi:hypothetical protein
MEMVNEVVLEAHPDGVVGNGGLDIHTEAESLQQG